MGGSLAGEGQCLILVPIYKVTLMRIRTQGRGSFRSDFLIGSNSGSSSKVEIRPPSDKPALRQNVPRTLVDHQVCTDTVTPGFHKKSSRGKKLPVNPLSIISESVQDPAAPFDYYYQTVRNSGGSTNWGWRCASSAPVVGMPPVAERVPMETPNSLLIEATANLKSALWDIGTFAAELNSTVGMLLGVKKSFLRRRDVILDIIGKKKRRRPVTRQEALQEFNSMWLEARYGWRPLMYDLMDAKEAYDRIGSKVEYLKKSSSRTANADSKTPWERFSRWEGSQAIWSRWSVQSTREIRAFVAGHVDTTVPARVDPLITLYEVIPYSFVVDWFVNIGSNLQAFTPFSKGVIDWSGVTEVQTDTFISEFAVTHATSNTVVNESLNYQPIVVSRRHLVRNPRNATMELSLRNHLTVPKGIDLLALASQMYMTEWRPPRSWRR